MKIIPGERYTFRPAWPALLAHEPGAPDLATYDSRACTAIAHPVGHPAYSIVPDLPAGQALVRFDDGRELLAFTHELTPAGADVQLFPLAFEIGQRCRFTDEQRIERSRISGTVCEVIDIIRLSPQAECYYRVRFDYGHVLWTLAHDLEALPADVEAGA